MHKYIEMPCAICGKDATYTVKYAQTKEFDLTFAARRQPGGHFRMVRCDRCGLIYSNPIIDPEDLKVLYEDSPFIEEHQIGNMTRDYKRNLDKAFRHVEHKGKFIEVGCANGFLLEQMIPDFEEVVGVEPGRAAVEAASPEAKKRIINDFFSADLFEPESFDAACCFQVADHLLDPNAFFSELTKVLKPGGVFVSINHNIRSWFTRILGSKSPMYDVEHIYLFSPETMPKMLEKHGLETISCKGIPNRYALEYVTKMFPFPKVMKKGMTSLLKLVRLSEVSVSFRAGNMMTVARKIR